MACVFFLGAAAFSWAGEHHEFEATLQAPYRGGPDESRTFVLSFDYPGSRARTVAWRLELRGPGGRLVRAWQAAERMAGTQAEVRVRWDGRGRGSDGRLPAGLYSVRMQARTVDAAAGAGVRSAEQVEQGWEISVGERAAPAIPAFAPLASSGAAAAGSLPYTVYYGNLHSQTNHSDGGAAVEACGGAQHPQSAPYGPADAFAYARERGLDFLMTSEHNHMYDGSDGANPAASAGAARALYQSGLAAARAFADAHPGFVPLYGLEWGVISRGGHINILNADELLGWEHDSDGVLLADTLTPRGDYAGLYTLMKNRGWIGQFNHPAWRGQFYANGRAFGHTPDGDEAMALCEVLNSTAFSTNTTESEPRRSSYEGACNQVLEAGFHVAFSSNQDNHCANWGASYTNRTAVLLPQGVPLNAASLLDAIRARRVFATMDKSSQLVFIANGHMMGERFASSGPLKLVASFASLAGKRVSSVAIFEGVPGRNGIVTQLSDAAEAVVTPTPGEHFYYARVTQEDGNMLWSAPVWVTQAASPPP